MAQLQWLGSTPREVTSGDIISSGIGKAIEGYVEGRKLGEKKNLEREKQKWERADKIEQNAREDKKLALTKYSMSLKNEELKNSVAQLGYENRRKMSEFLVDKIIPMLDQPQREEMLTEGTITEKLISDKYGKSAVEVLRKSTLANGKTLTFTQKNKVESVRADILNKGGGIVSSMTGMVSHAKLRTRQDALDYISYHKLDPKQFKKELDKIYGNTRVVNGKTYISDDNGKTWR